MISENTKYKNDSNGEALNNRIRKLEKILQQLVELSLIPAKNKGNSLIESKTDNSGDAISGGLLAEFASINNGNSKISENNPSFTYRFQQKPAKTGANNLLLSHGQIMAEFAAAIGRIGQRNS